MLFFVHFYFPFFVHSYFIINIDGVTKAEYEENLEENIRKLANNLQNMSYVPSPSKKYIYQKQMEK